MFCFVTIGVKFKNKMSAPFCLVILIGLKPMGKKVHGLIKKNYFKHMTIGTLSPLCVEQVRKAHFNGFSSVMNV